MCNLLNGYRIELQFFQSVILYKASECSGRRPLEMGASSHCLINPPRDKRLLRDYSNKTNCAELSCGCITVS